ncbi:hypothetical protein [Burkholderia arboris]|uniref:hypothetical protein n=1 Tax=Burkholderia arboris TaxID=488730 RepID=UPI001CF313E7|nr:hypothetical protein [Burkholderia arboris]MCA8050662.1 hypothetical protein [Burkholderia arboris]HEP6430557.1 hypothetical protein [Burkholderia cenocepacia]
MSDDRQVSARRAPVQPTTWGNPRQNRTPRFNKQMLGFLRRLNKWLGPIAIFEFLIIVTLILTLAFGTQFARLFASDGSMYSCEIPLVAGQRK